MTDKVQKIRETVENRYEYWKEKESNSHSIESEIRMSECKHLLLMLDSLQEEPVSDDLEKEIRRWMGCFKHCPASMGYKETATHFANWQKQQIMENALPNTVKVDAQGYPYVSAMELYDYDNETPLAEEGDKVMLVVLKDE